MTIRHENMTECSIEQRVERAIDRADAAFLAGQLTQTEYDAKIDAINHWADRRYSELRDFIARNPDAFDPV